MKKVFSLVIYTLVIKSTALYAIVDIEQEIYAPAAEMQMLDDAMNRGIQEQRERNLQKPMVMMEDSTFFTDDVLGFNLVGNQYILEKHVQDVNNTEVKTKLENRVLTVTEVKRIEQVTIEESVTLGSNSTTKQYFTSTTSETLSLPQDADEKTFKSKYQNGVLKITIQQK
jgi:hypothetical protein